VYGAKGIYGYSGRRKAEEGKVEGSPTTRSSTSRLGLLRENIEHTTKDEKEYKPIPVKVEPDAMYP
jgi:hypothetical protein